jgi:hypothetical protein
LEMESHKLYAQSWSWTMILPILVSQIARITGLSHWHPAQETFFQRQKSWRGVVVHFCNPSTWEAETGEWRVWGQPGLHKVKPCLGWGRGQKTECHGKGFMVHRGGISHHTWHYLCLWIQGFFLFFREVWFQLLNSPRLNCMCWICTTKLPTNQLFPK